MKEEVKNGGEGQKIEYEDLIRLISEILSQKGIWVRNTDDQFEISDSPPL